MGISSRRNLIISICVAVFCVVTWLVFNVNTEKPKETVNNTERRTKVRKARPPLRKVQAKRNKKREITETNIKTETRQKPNMFVFEDAEEKELTELARKVLVSLQAALDSEDYDQILKIIEMANAAAKGSLGKTTEGMPVALRKKIVEALGWFGSRAIPEMAGFLADPNAEVFQMTVDQFEQALSDITLGDRARAKILTLASSILRDRDALDLLMMEVSNMRPSVTADTINSVFLNGTPEAKDAMQEILDFVLGEENIRTIEDLQRWKDEHPDDPDDEDIYGPMELDD